MKYIVRVILIIDAEVNSGPEADTLVRNALKSLNLLDALVALPGISDARWGIMDITDSEYEEE